MIDRMKTLLREKDTCVLATVSRGKPHCSFDHVPPRQS